ncbi:histone deacetylase [Actinacidiphila acididurans]|uniref:Histone deacetylase n=1 Tax=Actinacidiphila acididurans TaxID=2784346 RepID=A0ABS2TRD2_9ACTN|nr:histone deacetylase [Actinacidiphila acididurans]MBM9505372.1 histone deacetylase [Actinacidiphila acididurans]
MHAARLACYLAGGRPAGGGRAYPGCRDARPPRGAMGLELPGALYFATRSPVWGGGRAFYDPAAAGKVLARAHLITAGQFADLAAQEMYAAPGTDLDLTEALETGRQVLGPGRYQTLVCPGRREGHPLLTLTAPWRMSEVDLVPPSRPYLRHLVAGLLEAGDWDPAAIARYLARCPGAAGHWSERQVRAMAGHEQPPPPVSRPR